MATNKNLAATITIGGAVSGTLTAAFGNVKGKLGEIGKTVTDLTKRQKLLGRAIQDFGRAGKNVDGLRNSYAKLSTQIDRARRAQERLTKAQAFQAKASKVGGYLKSGAMYAGAGAATIGLLARPTIGAAIGRENAINILRNSGASKEEQDAMIGAATAAKQFGVSTTDAVKTVAELKASLGHTTDAISALPMALQAKSGLQLYNRLHAGKELDEDSAYSLSKIADERGGAGSPAEMQKQMNWAFKAITGSQGKLSAADILTAQRGAKAAGVGASDEAFFGDTFLMQALGAPQYGKALSTLNNAWIGGHQDAHKFTNMYHDGLLQGVGKNFSLKNGLVTGYTSNALVDSKLMISDQQAWVEKYLIPLAKKKGINLDDDAAVQAFVSNYTSNTSAGNVLFQRVKNSRSIDRDRANVLDAHGISESDAANKNSSAGKMGNAESRLNDAMAETGKVLLPALNDAMEKTASVLERLNVFAKEHPTLFKGIVEGVVGLGGALLVAVPVLLTANGILTTIAMVKLARAAAEVTSVVDAMGGVEGAAAGASRGILGLIGRLAGAAAAPAAIASVATLTTDQEDDELKNGPAKWAALRAKYPKSVIDAARKKYQPWYQLGGGYASENEEWIKKYQADQKSPPAVPQSNKAAQSITSNDTYHISITQQPGQDENALADAVMKRIQKKTAVQQRSIMFDGASQ